MWVNVLLIAAFCAMCGYLLWLSYLMRGKAIASKKSKSSSPSLAIIICTRNDEKSLFPLIKNIEIQMLQQPGIELIIVNDNDPQYNLNFPVSLSPSTTLLETGGKGKKIALQTGIQFVKSDWIVTLDADVVLSTTWITTLCNELDTQADLCILPLQISKGKGVLCFFQWTEFYLLQLITRGSANRGRPLLCNGAHLAFRRKAWIEDYLPNMKTEITGGDDQFLLETFRIKNKKIVFLDNLKHHCLTLPQLSWGSLLSQRRRWSSKTPRYQLWDMSALAYVTLLSNLGCFWFEILLVTGKGGPLIAGALLLYFGVEFSWGYSHFKSQPLSTFLFLLFYPLYVVSTLISFLIFKTEWKGRTVNV